MDMCLAACRNDLDGRVVIRDAAGIETTGWINVVGFRPVDLHRSRLDAFKDDAPAIFAEFVAQDDRIPCTEFQAGCIFRRHEHAVASGSDERVYLGSNHAIELLSASGGEKESPFGNRLLRQINRCEPAFAVRGFEPIRHEIEASVLDLISLFVEHCDPSVRRADSFDLVSDVMGVSPGEDLGGLLRIEPPSDHDRNFPFVPGLAGTRSRYLGTVDNPPLRACLSPAAMLFVACPRRE